MRLLRSNETLLRPFGLKQAANAPDHRRGPMTAGDDLLERLLGLVQIGHRAIEEVQARIGIRDHRGERLLHLVNNRSCDCVARHQPGLTFAALGADREQQSRIERRYLIKQDP
jgi:hypothetical protein